MTLVALSASYGAAGTRIGPALAERLDVPFDDAAAHDEHVSANWLERVLSGFVGQDTVAPTPIPAQTISSDEFRLATEEVLLRQAATGMGVILGRGAVMVLQDDPRVLRVRLDGPPERRARQAMELQGLDQETAERAMRQADRTHEAYVRHFYGARLDDTSLYHLVLDSTAISVDACVEIIAIAARSMAAAPA
jgi:hypothetical protein